MEGSNLEVPVKGMDCAECARRVKNAVERVPGVQSAEVLLSSEKTLIQSVDNNPDYQQIKKAIEDAGYSVPESADTKNSRTDAKALAQRINRLIGIVFGAILTLIVLGEWLGLFESLTQNIPFWVGAAFVLIIGYPVFWKVIKTSFRGEVIAQTFMSVGAIAALVTGEWITAAIVTFFMRTGDYIEYFTAEQARKSVRSLTELAPQQATVLRDGEEEQVPVDEVQPGDHIVVRPGEKVPVDGKVIDGNATLNQSAITGESMPVEVSEESEVFAATFVDGGRITLEATAIGSDTTFGHIIKMVEEAESRKGRIQQFADKFSAYYLPVMVTIAVLTYLFSGNLMATVAVMVVACPCAFALATPVALLSAIGSSARNGVLVKGGKYIEMLSRADVLLIDKTGTLTFGRPEISDVISLNGYEPDHILRLAAGAERYSEHPLAKAVVESMQQKDIALPEADDFSSQTGSGVKATIEGATITVGKPDKEAMHQYQSQISPLRESGKSLMIVCKDGEPMGILAAKDAERTEAKDAIDTLKQLGITQIELLTGDHPATAKTLAEKLKIGWQADLLPEDKIERVRHYQQEGKTVMMVGDGINDAPAMAQADISIAMGVRGTDVAKETSHITLLREDWSLIPGLYRKSQKTMRTIKGNFAFTTVYNIIGLSLAAFGILPPILAAAAQSVPDVGIMVNSSRLLKK